MNGGHVALVVKLAKEKNKYSKTLVQKTLYFTTHDNCFEPYPFGMYCPGVQRMLFYFEENPNKINEFASEVMDKKFEKL